MVYTDDDKRYLDKLRMNYPNRDIPTDDVVKNTLSQMVNDDEVVIDDLCIRIWDGIIEMELI